MPSWSGLYDGVYGQPYAPLLQFNSIDRTIARLSATQGGTKFGEIASALAAGGVGAGTVYSYKQVAAVQTDGLNQGGIRPISEYFVVPQRTTTILDREYVQAQFRPTWAPNPYPVDKSNNGGGGKLGTL